MRTRAAVHGVVLPRVASTLAAAAAAAAGLLMILLQSQPALAAPPLRAVTDDLSLTVRVGAAPLRIVSLSPGATEMLFAAGAGAGVIATTEYSDEPPTARGIPRIGDVAAIDMERLVALRPGVVVAWPGGGNPAQRQRIAALGIPVYEQQVDRLADLPGSLRRLGALAGSTAIAERAARALEARLSALRHAYAGGAWGPERRPSVLLQIWNRPIYTVGGRQLMSDALTLCGARNLFSDLPEPAPLVDIEAVIRRNPDVILAAAPNGEGAAWVADWQRFATLEAVRRHRAIVFEDQGLSRLGPTVVAATEHLCRTIVRLKIADSPALSPESW